VHWKENRTQELTTSTTIPHTNQPPNLLVIRIGLRRSTAEWSL